MGMARRISRQVMVDRIAIGGGAPVVVQSMTNTDTADAEATTRQAFELWRAVPSASAVSVLVIDCTTTGAPPPMATVPTSTRLETLRPPIANPA